MESIRVPCHVFQIANLIVSNERIVIWADICLINRALTIWNLNRERLCAFHTVSNWKLIYLLVSLYSRCHLHLVLLVFIFLLLSNFLEVDKHRSGDRLFFFPASSLWDGVCFSLWLLEDVDGLQAFPLIDLTGCDNRPVEFALKFLQSFIIVNDGGILCLTHSCKRW